MHKQIIYILLALSLVSQVAAEGITLNCGRQAGMTQCQLDLGKQQVLDVFELSNPRRFVVDLNQPNSKIKFKPVVAKSLDVIAVRSGIHPDKYRLVFDILETAGPISWKNSGANAWLKFPESELNTVAVITPTNTEKLSEPEPVPVLKPERPVSEVKRELNVKPVEQIAVLKPSNTEKSGNAYIVRPPSPEVLQEAQSGQVFASVDFHAGAGTQKPPAVVLSFSENPQFSFSKMSAGSYRLNVPDARLISEQFRRPYFPPHHFPRVGYVELQQDQQKGLLITIGVERGTELKAVAQGNAVIVQVLN